MFKLGGVTDIITDNLPVVIRDFEERNTGTANDCLPADHTRPNHFYNHGDLLVFFCQINHGGKNLS